MQTLSSIINKHLRLEDPEFSFQSLENIDDYVLISKNGLREIGSECFIEGMKSANANGGHKPDYFTDFTKQDS